MKRVVGPWYRDFYKVTTAIFGAGLLGVAVTVGVYMNKVDRLETLYDVTKEVAAMKERIAVLEERTKGSNASLPPSILRPMAGEQR